jgi:hypothetical protein
MLFGIVQLLLSWYTETCRLKPAVGRHVILVGETIPYLFIELQFKDDTNER